MNPTIKSALQAVKLLDYFNSLSPSHQKEYLNWVNGAKKKETQERRIMKMINMLREKSVTTRH